VTPASLGVLTFRYRAVEGSDVAVDRFNASIAERISRSGFAYITTTELGNRLVLRMCPINPGATRDDVDETFVRLEQAAHLTAQIE
jgi:glutamate/tyrosine decarboxylase-like PLP-dependent enzyme